MSTKTSVLYWKEIPVQVKCEDANSTVSLPLDPRFQEAADAVAMMDGSYGSDAYLDAWQWGDAIESELDAGTAAKQLAEHINNGMPGDFVARIRDLHDTGNRVEEPGAIDHWIK